MIYLPPWGEYYVGFLLEDEWEYQEVVVDLAIEDGACLVRGILMGGGEK